jgi:tetratricopeptide (TPR) repeat protein
VTLCCWLGTSSFPDAGATAHAQHVASATPRARAFVPPFSYEWFVRGELLLAREQYAAAAEAYRMALSSADEDPYLLARLAEALDRAGDAAGAENALQAGLEVDPQSEAIWLERGTIARRAGRIGDAIAAFERAEAAAPASPDAPLALADLLRAQGNAERAAAVLERFAARADARGEGVLRARIELARVRGDRAALARAARAWLRRAPVDAEVLAHLAADLLAAGEPALAARVLAVTPPAAVDARVALAVALALARSEQVELLLAVTPPDRVGGTLEVAEAYLRIGRSERALAALEEAGDADPSRRALLTGLAQLDLGNVAAAARELSRVPPGSAYAARARSALAEALQSAALGALATEVGAVK